MTQRSDVVDAVRTRTAVRIVFMTLMVFIGLMVGSLAATAQTANFAGGGRRGKLGKVLSSAYGGQIFGFDVNQSGNDGIIDDAVSLSNGGLKSAIETFDITTGKITKIVKSLVSKTSNDELVTFGIGGNDVGLVDEERATIENQHVTRNDLFYLLNPVAGQEITGPWTLPDSKNALLWQLSQNQSTSTQLAVVYRFSGSNSVPWLYLTDLAANTIVKSFPLTIFQDNFLLMFAQDTATDEAVTAISSYPGGPPPPNVVINLKTEKIRQFNGFNNGPYGAGGINGLAVDSTTGILCTTTELNAQVEFYKLSDGSGTWAQLPGTGDSSQLNSASSVTNDPVHHLFLVTQPVSSTGGVSAVYVYDEKGNLKETINGFNFNTNLPPSFGLKIVLNPTKRIGWVQGANPNQLQQFFY
jgi:hypothetical protein